MSSSLQRGRARLSVHIPDRKDVDFEQPPHLIGGTLSPDLQPATPPTYPTASCKEVPLPPVKQIGSYVLVHQTDCVGDIQVFRAFHCDSQEEFVCKMLPLEKYQSVLSPYWAVGDHQHINQVEEILLGSTQAYVIFPRHYGDLHSYVRRKRRLREAEAGRLFHQISSAIAHCHSNHVVLRDLKLRKFVFKNPQRTELVLESLEDAFVLADDGDDHLADKHGCPAYVSPEILTTPAASSSTAPAATTAGAAGYSGRAADVWSAGVMLYTLLIGRYPFHDVEPSALFSKIRRGDYHVPDTVSSRAKCLIRSLLRHAPDQRLTAHQVLDHPWFRRAASPRVYGTGGAKADSGDQAVPDCGGDAVTLQQEQDDFL